MCVCVCVCVCAITIGEYMSIKGITGHTCTCTMYIMSTYMYMYMYMCYMYIHTVCMRCLNFADTAFLHLQYSTCT